MKRINGVEMKKPEMILFDYGGTLVTEPQWDYLSGEKAVFKHIIKNPRCATPQQLNDFSIELFPEYEQCRRHVINGGLKPDAGEKYRRKEHIGVNIYLAGYVFGIINAAQDNAGYIGSSNIRNSKKPLCRICHGKGKNKS